MSDINATLDKVTKAITTADAGGSASLATSVLVRENLSEVVTRLTDTETAIRNRLSRKKGAGMAASWVVLTGITSGNSPFTEGGTPSEDDATYVRRTAVYKELGKTKTISTKMIYAGQSFGDVDARETENAIREVIQDEENLIINGDATTYPLQFDGLKTQITTNVTDDANNPLGFRVDLVNKAIKTIWSTKGVRPTAIYCGYGMKKAINESLIGDVRVNLNDGNTVAHGVDVGFIQTMAGKLPVVPTVAITSSTYGSNTVEDLYIVTEKANGQDVLYMEDLYPLGKEYLAKTGASTKFMVTECTVLVNRAEEMHYKFQNVRVD